MWKWTRARLRTGAAAPRSWESGCRQLRVRCGERGHAARPQRANPDAPARGVEDRRVAQRPAPRRGPAACRRGSRGSRRVHARRGQPHAQAGGSGGVPAEKPGSTRGAGNPLRRGDRPLARACDNQMSRGETGVKVGPHRGHAAAEPRRRQGGSADARASPMDWRAPMAGRVTGSRAGLTAPRAGWPCWRPRGGASPTLPRRGGGSTVVLGRSGSVSGALRGGTCRPSGRCRSRDERVWTTVRSATRGIPVRHA